MSIGYMFFFNWAKVRVLYNQLIKDIQLNKFSLLEEIHHLSSGMKSLYTSTCIAGLMTIRESCGGAGFTAWSSLPFLVDDFAANVTLEGDNTVMAQQSARYL